jgi:hypothetical protein
VFTGEKCGLKNGTDRLFPEILLDPHNSKSSRWQRGRWWFHVSANLCEGNGEANVYRRNGVFQCAHRKRGWEANNPPLPETDIVEIKIACSKVNISPVADLRVGLSFGVTNATEDKHTQTWFLWPMTAKIDSPTLGAKRS